MYLSLTGDPSEIQVTFTTSSKPSAATVTFWPDGATLLQRAVVVLSASNVNAFSRPVTGMSSESIQAYYEKVR